MDATYKRRRLGQSELGDRWFHFGKTHLGLSGGEIRSVEEIADLNVLQLKSEAEEWWLANFSPDPNS